MLILRLAVSIFLVRWSFDALTITTGFWQAVPLLISTGAGLFLLLGLWTPIAGLLVALIELWMGFSRPADSWAFVLAAAVGAALALLGPGAWSIDAQIYGRKRISIHDR